jgi:hypothetical protein
MNIEFETLDIEISIQELLTYSAQAPDGVPVVLLKQCVGTLKVPLTLLWKISFREGNVPSDQKLVLIIPIYEGGARDKPQNYRPITLASQVIEVFEKVVTRRLVQYMEEADLFNRRQQGLDEIVPIYLNYWSITTKSWPCCRPGGRSVFGFRESV